MTARETFHQIAAALGLDPLSAEPAQVIELVLFVLGEVVARDKRRQPTDVLTDDDGHELRAPRCAHTTTAQRRSIMDPEKAFAAVAKALGLEEGAGPDKVLRKLQAIVDYLAADAEPEAPEAEPEPEAAEASKDASDAVTASDEPAAPVVEADAAPDSDAVALADPVDVEDLPTEDPAAGELQALLTALSDATGMDEASLLAAIRDQLDAVAALLTGQPDSGMPAEEAGMARSAALSAAKAGQDALKAKLASAAESAKKLTARIAELEADADVRLIDDAIAKGHILAKDRAVYAALSRADRSEFRTQLSAAADSPAVPTGDIVTGKGSGPGVGTADPEVDVDDHPDVVRLTKSLTAAQLIDTASGKAALAAARAKAAAN